MSYFFYGTVQNRIEKNKNGRQKHIANEQDLETAGINDGTKRRAVYRLISRK